MQSDLDIARFERTAERADKIAVYWTHVMAEEYVSILVCDKSDEKGIVVDVPESLFRAPVGGKYSSYFCQSDQG